LLAVAAIAVVAATAVLLAVAQNPASLPRHGHHAERAGRQPFALGAGRPINVGDDPVAIAITPDGRTAYVVNHNDNTVTPISLASGTPGPAIKVGLGPSAIAITPDGQTAYVANSGVWGGGSVGGETVTPISLATGTPGPPIKVGSDPMGIAITPDGRMAYVVNNAGNTVTPIRIR